ncbi:hypothetical protein At1D1609_49270 [Agrobacterium tumefaciens]|uniref:Uncharacterized protein n=2 Tax=Agrobacterium tumefaciens TaxID=358 RepID=A0A2L2LKV8_AGRTU|nr:hypothetical protein At1D1609_49270 [Agrobacterium tumefaciens]
MAGRLSYMRLPYTRAGVPATQSYVSVFISELSHCATKHGLAISGHMVGSIQELNMTEAAEISRLKFLAKRHARATRVALHEAFNSIAVHLGYANWTQLVSANKSGWVPSPEHVASIEAMVACHVSPADFKTGRADASARRWEYLEQAEQGQIRGHAYRLQLALDDVIIAGDGWSITVPENPSARPEVRTSAEADDQCPLFDPDFLEEALSLANDRMAQVRSKISTDWPRRSTKPDADGQSRHPLWDRDSDTWFCLHCDGKISGVQIAENLWHCPACGASPVDIFDTAFWCEDEGKSLPPIGAKAKSDSSRPDFQVVDDRPKLELSERNIVLLMRSALLDDARNVSERLGALLAEITVDEDNDVWISLEEDLWPDHKEPTQAIKVAAQLGIEIELETMWSKIPFHWPALGEQTSSTTEYVQMLLDAYAQYAVPSDSEA